MGYTILIGNGVMEPSERVTTYSREIGSEVRYYDVSVEEASSYAAPLFPGDEVTGKTNCRRPTVWDWEEFCQETGLWELFLGKEHGIMAGQGGFCQLKMEHLLAIRVALRSWEGGHPGALPGWGDGYDYALARLLWLFFWVSWALENCENAGLYYSV